MTQSGHRPGLSPCPLMTILPEFHRSIISIVSIEFSCRWTHMEEPPKETVIIVHGTWAAPDPAKRRWYLPVDDRPGDEAFTAKLDAALQERGSPARCWAHCTDGNPFFQWSGENSWIARTQAAAELGNYVLKLRDEGWCCHIVAHSHGGNVVLDALPQITTALPSNAPLGKIVTLGIPFIDTMAPIL